MKPLYLVLFLCLPVLATDQVENGNEPKGKPQTLVLTQELLVGPDSGEDHHTWNGDKIAVAVDPTGNMYLMDPGNFRILKLDPAGKLIKSMGREGQGPEEFIRLSSLSMVEDRLLYVFEQRVGNTVLTVLDLDLKIVERKQAPAFGGKYCQSALYSPNGKWVRAYWEQYNPQNVIMSGAILDKEYKDIDMNLMHYEVPPFDAQKFSDPNWLADFFGKRLSIAPKGQFMAQFAEDGALFTGVTNKYEITKWSPDLKKQLVITRKAKPTTQTEEEIEALADLIREEALSATPPSLHAAFTPALIKNAIEIAEFTEKKSALFGLVPLGDHLLALSNYNSLTGALVADIISPKGEFLGQVALPKLNYHYFGSYFGYYANLKTKNGKLYAIVESEDGDYQLARYQYKVQPK